METNLANCFSNRLQLYQSSHHIMIEHCRSNKGMIIRLDRVHVIRNFSKVMKDQVSGSDGGKGLDFKAYNKTTTTMGLGFFVLEHEHTCQARIFRQQVVNGLLSKKEKAVEEAFQG